MAWQAARLSSGAKAPFLGLAHVGAKAPTPKNHSWDSLQAAARRGEKNMAHSKAMIQSNGIRDSVLQAIGNTPVVRLRKVVTPSMADVLVKLEYYNPTGSYK